MTRVDKFNPPYSEAEESYLKTEYEAAIAVAIVDIIVLILLLVLDYKLIKFTKCGNHRVTLLIILMTLTIL